MTLNDYSMFVMMGLLDSMFVTMGLLAHLCLNSTVFYCITYLSVLYNQVELTWFSGRRLNISMSSTVKQLHKLSTAYDEVLIQINCSTVRFCVQQHWCLASYDV